MSDKAGAMKRRAPTEVEKGGGGSEWRLARGAAAHISSRHGEPLTSPQTPYHRLASNPVPSPPISLPPPLAPSLWLPRLPSFPLESQCRPRRAARDRGRARDTCFGGRRQGAAARVSIQHGPRRIASPQTPSPRGRSPRLGQHRAAREAREAKGRRTRGGGEKGRTRGWGARGTPCRLVARVAVLSRFPRRTPRPP